MGNGVKKINERIMAPYRTIIITDPAILLDNSAPDGTLYIDPTLSLAAAGESVKIKKASGSWANLVPKNLFKLGSITNDIMGTDSVTGSNIKAASIQSSHIGDGQITSRTLGVNAVSASNILNGAVSMGKLSVDVQTKINVKTQISVSAAPPNAPSLNDMWVHL